MCFALFSRPFKKANCLRDFFVLVGTPSQCKRGNLFSERNWPLVASDFSTRVRKASESWTPHSPIARGRIHTSFRFHCCHTHAIHRLILFLLSGGGWWRLMDWRVFELDSAIFFFLWREVVFVVQFTYPLTLKPFKRNLASLVEVYKKK